MKTFLALIIGVKGVICSFTDMFAPMYKSSLSSLSERKNMFHVDFAVKAFQRTFL